MDERTKMAWEMFMLIVARPEQFVGLHGKTAGEIAEACFTDVGAFLAVRDLTRTDISKLPKGPFKP